MPSVVTLPFLNGAEYFDCLRMIHKALRPQRYLEIGVYQGESLACATCESIAIDVDFVQGHDALNNKPACHFYRMPSDEFFIRHDAIDILKGPLDLAFLDGMHLHEFLLRDFANTERVCRPDSVIMLHDCLPIDPRITHRSMDPIHRQEAVVPGWWTGDVWKTLVILKRHRPDLRFIALDAHPTGLVLISRLDPGNTRLSEQYDALVDEADGLDLQIFGVDQLFALADVRSTSMLENPAELCANLWL